MCIMINLHKFKRNLYQNRHLILLFCELEIPFYFSLCPYEFSRGVILLGFPSYMYFIFLARVIHLSSLESLTETKPPVSTLNAHTGYHQAPWSWPFSLSSSHLTEAMVQPALQDFNHQTHRVLNSLLDYTWWKMLSSRFSGSWIPGLTRGIPGLGQEVTQTCMLTESKYPSHPESEVVQVVYVDGWRLHYCLAVFWLAHVLMYTHCPVQFFISISFIDNWKNTTVQATLMSPSEDLKDHHG